MVKSEFIIENKNLKDYEIIENIILKNDNISNIFKDDIKEEEDTIYQKLLKEFDRDSVNQINKNQEGNYKSSNDFNINLITMKIRENKYLYYAKDFFVLNNEIYNSFKSLISYIWNSNEQCSYFSGDNKLFLIIDKYNQNLIEVCKINDINKGFEIDLLLNYDDKVERDKGVNYIIENGYNDFLNLLLLNENDYSFPIFNENQKMIGYAYKYDSEIKDYTNLNINFEIGKIFLLYMYYRKLNKNYFYEVNNNFNNQINNINNSFKEYYIINEEWIKEYKNYYNYDIICRELDKNISNQNLFNTLNEDNITDKKLYYIIIKLPKEIIKSFNEKDKNFKKYYKNDKTKTPFLSGINLLDNSKNHKELFYYDKFEIISTQLYEALFLDININFISKGNRDSFVINESNPIMIAKCLFENDKILVKINNNFDNKYIIEVGKLNNNIFNPEVLLVYDKSDYLNNHIQNLILYGGFNDYYQNLQNIQENTIDIIDNNNVIGMAVKIKPYINLTINNDNNLKNVQNNQKIYNKQNIQNNNLYQYNNKSNNNNQLINIQHNSFSNQAINIQQI